MPKLDSESLHNTIDLASKALSLSFKLGILAGSACLLFYCEQIHYLPAGFTAGDGILLFFLAAILGYVYIMDLASLTGLGVFEIFVLQKVAVLARLVINKMGMLKTCKRILGKAHMTTVISIGINAPLSPELPLAVPFAFIGVALLYMLKAPTASFTLFMTSLALGVLVLIYRYLSSKATEPSKVQESQGELSAPIHVVDAIKHSNKQTGSWVVLFVIFFLPIFASGISERLLDVGMRLAHIRQDRSTIWLKAPYSELLLHHLKRQTTRLIPGLTRFSNINILLSGFGQTTVFDFKNGQKVELMTVPNKSIIIGPRAVAWIPSPLKKQLSEAKPAR